MSHEEMTAKREVAYHFRPDAPGAWKPGSFTTHLLNAFGAADTHNFLRLTSAFPAYGLAMRQAMHGHDGGISTLLLEIAPAGKGDA